MAVLFVLTFLLSAGNGAIFALLPQIQEAGDLPTWSLGLIVGASFGAGLVAQLCLARFADRGHARVLLVGGAIVGACGYVAVGYGEAVWSIAGGRGVAGLGIGMVYPAARKLLVARHPERAGQMLGRFLAFDVTGFVLGAPLAAIVVSVASVPATFALFSAAIVLCLPFVVRLRWVESQESVAAARADRGVLRRLVRRRRLRAGLALGAGTFWAIGVFDTIWARYLTDLGSSALFIGVTLTCFGLPMALLAGLGGRLSDRRGPLPVGLLAGICAVPFMVSYGQIGSPMLLVIVTTGHALVDALSMPASQATVVAECDAHEIASGQGLLSAVQLSTAASAALLVAPIYGRFGAGVTFAGAGLVMTLAWGVAAQQAGFDPRRHRRRSGLDGARQARPGAGVIHPGAALQPDAARTAGAALQAGGGMELGVAPLAVVVPPGRTAAP